MDVSNGTGDGTDYRTGSGTTKVSTFRHLPGRSTQHFADPKPPWSISFRLPDSEIISATFDQPMASVTLVKVGNSFKIEAKPVEVAKPKPKPVRKPQAKAPKPPVKATKPTKPAKTPKSAKPTPKKKSAA